MLRATETKDHSIENMGEVIVVVLNIHFFNAGFSQYSLLSATKKIDYIAERCSVLCTQLASSDPDAMWIFVWCEYGITSATNKMIAVSEADYLKTKMLALTQKYPQLVIIPGTVLIRKEFPLLTLEEIRAAEAHLIEVEQSYRTPLMKKLKMMEEKFQQFEVSLHHKSVLELLKLLTERNRLMPEFISSLTNTAFVFQQNRVVAEVHKVAPMKETQGQARVAFHPLYTDHLVSLIHHKTKATIKIYLTICREAELYFASKSEKKRGKAFIHCCLSSVGFVTSDKMQENFLAVETLLYPRLIKANPNNQTKNLSVYQADLLGPVLTLHGPLQPLYPFERQILDLIDQMIVQLDDAEAAAILFKLRNLFTQYVKNFIATAKNLYDALNLWVDTLHKVMAGQANTFHPAFLSHNRYGEHRLFDKTYPQLVVFSQELSAKVAVESSHNPFQRDIFGCQPAPIEMKPMKN